MTLEGVGEFNRDIYLHQADWTLYDKHCSDTYRQKVLLETEVFPKLTTEQIEAFVPYRQKVFLPIQDGDSLDLGDISIVCYHVPGHTKGAIVVYIPALKVLITGDAIGEQTLIIFEESASMSEYRDALQQLVSRQLDVDVVLRQHGTNESLPVVLENNLILAQRIIEGCDDKVRTITYGIPCYKGKDVTRYQEKDKNRVGNIYYTL